MMRRFSRSRRAGFSLVEMLVALLVLSIALASAFELNYHLSMITTRNRNLSAAVNLADTKLEELRNADYADVDTGADDGTLDATGAADGIFSRSWVVASDTPVAGLKKVTVTVSWEQWGEAQSYDLVGVVSQ